MRPISSIGKLVLLLCVFVAGCEDSPTAPVTEPVQEVQQPMSAQEAQAQKLWADLQAMTTAEDAQRVSQQLEQWHRENVALTQLRVQRVAYDPCEDEVAEVGFAAGNWYLLSNTAVAAYVAGGYNPLNPVFLTASATAGLAFGYMEYKRHEMYECYGEHGVSWEPA